MSVKIRLRRIGRKKQPYYRLVVCESTSPRDGAYLDTVGFYNPGRKPAELRMDLEKVEAWTSKGAEMSDTMRSLVRKARKGGDKTVELMQAEAQAAGEAVAGATSLRGTPERATAPSAQPEAAPAPSAETEPAPAGPPPEPVEE